MSVWDADYKTRLYLCNLAAHAAISKGHGVIFIGGARWGHTYANRIFEQNVALRQGYVDKDTLPLCVPVKLSEPNNNRATRRKAKRKKR